MPFAPVTKILWETKFLMRSNASVMNERMVLIVLIVPLVLATLAVVLLVMLEKSSTVSSVKQLAASKMLLVFWL